MTESIRTVLEKELRMLKNMRQVPSPYELQKILSKRGIQAALGSGVMRALQGVLEECPDPEKFIEVIFKKVTDSRDLNYRFGPCECNTCKYGIWVLIPGFNLPPHQTKTHYDS
ncbi:MAG: hypothetical protein UU70_C0026G0003 [Candidatus Yanofskybacteria bacterium GW2011_GWA1_41_6]|uniref:Uncharacterized protein n=1 Tax=Candidatus Yanofskybacteria bacterium GW2011_GWA1_41_6 TaxID=1619020 RepID=A0A0G0WJE0_9BACT|nr:MAG: hypothetical protein UU70_C0026G0003 [Candidatus Yanofskybacteria bacterium GW2011_GWA1_41_6]